MKKLNIIYMLLGCLLTFVAVRTMIILQQSLH